jgi:hypothetical protein
MDCPHCNSEQISVLQRTTNLDTPGFNTKIIGATITSPEGLLPVKVGYWAGVPERLVSVTGGDWGEGSGTDGSSIFCQVSICDRADE